MLVRYYIFGEHFMKLEQLWKVKPGQSETMGFC